MSIKKVSRKVAVAAMVLFSCEVDARWEYDYGGSPYYVLTETQTAGIPTNYFTLNPIPTDRSKTMDLLLQWTWPVSSD